MTKLSPTYLLLALLTLSTIFCGLGLDPYHSWGGDFALYISQAQAIIEGSTTQLSSLNAQAMENSEFILGPAQYPPGFPMMLVPFQYLWEGQLLPMKYLIVFCYVVFLIIFTLYSSDFLEGVWHNMLISLFALNPLFISYCNYVISDIPFLLMSLLIVWRLRRFEKKPNTRESLLLGLLFAIATWIRSIGIIWLLVYLMRYLYLYLTQGRHRPILLFPALSAFLMVGLSYLGSPGTSSSYLSYFSKVSLPIMWENFLVLTSLPHTYLGSLSSIFYVILLPLSVYGVIQFHRDFSYEILFVGFYTLILLSWPVQDGIRLWFPVIPFLILWGVMGMRYLAQNRFNLQKDSRGLRLFYGALACLLFGICVKYFAMDSSTDTSAKVGNPESIAFFNFMQQQGDPQGKIAFLDPRILRLYTGKESIASFSPTSLREKEIQQLILHKSFQKIDPSFFSGRPIFENKEFVVYAREEGKNP